MRCYVVSQWVKQSLALLFMPVIAFELVASVSAIDKVIYRITATEGTRMKMIQRQTRPGIAFPNATVPAAIFVEDANTLADAGTH